MGNTTRTSLLLGSVILLLGFAANLYAQETDWDALFSEPASDDSVGGDWNDWLSPESGSDTSSGGDSDFLDGWDFGDEEQDVAEEDIYDQSDNTRRRASRFPGLRGMTIKPVIASPFWTSSNLETWYSFIDYGLIVGLPLELALGPFPLRFAVEITHFDFSNSFPAGGTFKGFAAAALATVDVNGLGAELGGGWYSSTAAVFGGLSYTRFFNQSIYAKAAVRSSVALDIQPIGMGIWADVRLVMGYAF